MNEQVYYIEQWRDKHEPNRFSFTKCNKIELLSEALSYSKQIGLVTVAYFRIKLKDKK